jgi:hypothetical protein
MPHSFLPSALLWFLLAAVSVQAQTPPRPAPRPQARPAEPAPNCLVSEFRALALGTHDLNERGSKAADWLRRNASACSEEQLRIIHANRTNWLGNAESVQLTVQIEGALENRLKNRPEQLAQLFGAAPRPSPAASETMRAGELAPRPAPVVGPGTPAVVQGAAVVVPAAAAAATPGGTPPPRPGPPPPADKKPEQGKYFEPALRKAVQDYFTANRGDGPCPPGVVLKSGRCESPTANRSWKIGQGLPSSLTPTELPARLLEALGAVPKGHSYALVDGDILLIADEGKTVIDAVLDLGQVAPRR